MYKYIDVSYAQGSIDFESVKNDGVKGVIIRVGHTGYANKSMQIDNWFERNYEGFKKAGIPIGVYWFSRATTEAEAIKEAGLTLKFIKGKSIELPVYFDTEDTYYQAKISKQKLTNVAIAFLDVIENAGYLGGVYASLSWFNNKLEYNRLKDYEIWVAQYFTRCTFKERYDMWQYTSSGTVKGIRGRVDMNWSYKAYHVETAPPPEANIKKKYLYLSKAVYSWRVYPLNKPAVAGNEVGKLAPNRFGGLKYEILEELPNSVYVIKTQSFGKVKIYAGRNTLSTIKEE